MRIVRFSYGNEIKYGVLKENDIIEIQGDIFGAHEVRENRYNILEVKLLAPTCPSKIVCVGKNYREHALEMGEGIPEEPTLFLKPPTTVINPGDSIIYPDMSRRVDYEGELSVIIKSKCKNISPEDAPRYILGYTCGNDVTARDLQKKDGQWTRGKSFDTFCPLGPWIETELNPVNLKIQTYLNGQLKQSSSTSRMITPVYELVSFISKVMTLMPGDVIMTGTPEGIGPMQKGDTVEIVIEGIGKLKNNVL